MPDLFSLLERWWKFILGFTLIVTGVALVASLLAPKEYLSTATALPANSATADKARIFSNNIEALYPEIGSADELDKIEGTAALDTIYIAAAMHFGLAGHYKITSDVIHYKAAMRLKKQSKVSRSAYGELKVKVWDRDKIMAANLANFLLEQIQQIHQRLQSERAEIIVGKLETDYQLKERKFKNLSDSFSTVDRAHVKLLQMNEEALQNQLKQYKAAIAEHRLALEANAPVLLVVEKARPSHWPDKPRTLRIIVFSFFAALVFFLLLAIFLDSRKKR